MPACPGPTRVTSCKAQQGSCLPPPPSVPTASPQVKHPSFPGCRLSCVTQRASRWWLGHTRPQRPKTGSPAEAVGRAQDTAPSSDFRVTKVCPFPAEAGEMEVGSGGKQCPLQSVTWEPHAPASHVPGAEDLFAAHASLQGSLAVWHQGSVTEGWRPGWLLATHPHTRPHCAARVARSAGQPLCTGG